MLEEYHKYHTNRDNTRIGLFNAVAQNHSVISGLYPGSYTHITPSLVLEHMIYVDSSKKAKKFFDSLEVLDFVTSHSRYTAAPNIIFHLADYYSALPIEHESVDVLFSQYAGFVSKACHKYLKKGGILVANNTHGDADWARLSGLYTFIGVYSRESDTSYKLTYDLLNQYFISKKDQEITLDNVEIKQSGYGYTHTPSGYLFLKK